MSAKRTAASIPLVISIVVFWCVGTVQASVITNPGFESGQNGLMPSGKTTQGDEFYEMPDDWSWRKEGNMNGHSTHQNDAFGWSSEGDWSLYMYAASNRDDPLDHFPGNYLEFYQLVDLTNIVRIEFDVLLKPHSYTESDSSYSYVSIGSTEVWSKLWSGDEAGTFEDTVTIDTSMLSGVYELALGVEVLESFIEGDGYTYFDNLIAIPEPLTFSVLCLGSLGLLAKRKRPRETRG